MTLRKFTIYDGTVVLLNLDRAMTVVPTNYKGAVAVISFGPELDYYVTTSLEHIEHMIYLDKQDKRL